MAIRVRRTSPGFTLGEVLMVVLLMAVLGASIVGLLIASARAGTQGEFEQRSQERATWAVARMSPDIRKAMEVLESAPSAMTVRIPAVDRSPAGDASYNRILTDADGQPYLAAGDAVRYYLGDAQGHPQPNGGTLWRVVTHADGSPLRSMQVADGITPNPPVGAGAPAPLFRYRPDADHPQTVQITVTVATGRGRYTATSTVTGEVSLRNR